MHKLSPKLWYQKKYRSPVSRFGSKTSDFVLDNWRRIWFLFLWLVLNISLFAWKFYQYERRSAFEMMGYCVCVAKGAAETLKLNMAFILLPVCWNTLTRLRSTALSSIIPFDDSINFHKVIRPFCPHFQQKDLQQTIKFFFPCIKHVQVTAVGITIGALIQQFLT